MFFETKTKKLSKNDYFCAIKNMKLPKPSTMNCRYILLFTSVFAFLTSKTDVKAQQNFHFSPRISNLQIRDICQEERIPFFFKQWGGWNKKKNGHELDGKIYKEMPNK